MGYKIEYKKRFVNDLYKVVVYLENEWGNKVADEFAERLSNALDILASHPYIGAPSKIVKGARGLSITPHNRLFYKIKNNTIIILKLADTREKGYH